jgi:hypothetical protein
MKLAAATALDALIEDVMASSTSKKKISTTKIWWRTPIGTTQKHREKLLSRHDSVCNI